MELVRRNEPIDCGGLYQQSVCFQGIDSKGASSEQCFDRTLPRAASYHEHALRRTIFRRSRDIFPDLGAPTRSARFDEHDFNVFPLPPTFPRSRDVQPRNWSERDTGSPHRIITHSPILHIHISFSAFSRLLKHTNGSPAGIPRTPCQATNLYSLNHTPRLCTVHAMDASFPSCSPHWIMSTPEVNSRGDESEEQLPIPNPTYVIAMSGVPDLCSVFHIPPIIPIALDN